MSDDTSIDDELFSRLLDEFDSAYRANDLNDFWSRRDCSQAMRERVEKAHSGLQTLDSYLNQQTVADDSQAAQSQQLSSWFSKPFSLDRFQIIREIGRGGFGIVYLAIDPRLNRQVAIKIPRVENAGKQSVQNRFIQEAEIAASLDHPNIVPVFEVGSVGNVERNIYIVSLFCPGDPLSKWLEQNPEVLNNQQKLELLICICDAMNYCHRRGILHRDIKPSNILLFPEPSGNLPFVPRITDFGLARAQESALAETATSAMLGTPLYMAPEQACSHFDKISPATDVYAIGVLFYELLTGRTPFQGTMTEILDKVRHDSPQPLRQIDKSISFDLETICLKCLAKSPKDRYQDAGEVLDDLLAFASGKPIRARRPGFPRRMVRWSKTSLSKSLSLWLVILFSLAIVILLVNSTFFSRTNKSQLTQDRSSPNEINSDLESHFGRFANDLRKVHSLWQFGKKQEASAIFDSLSKLPTESIQKSFAWHFLKNRIDYRKQEFTGMPGKILCADFAPDQHRIAGADRLGNVAIWEIGSSQPIRQFNYSGKEVCDISFSPNGKMLAATGQDSMIHIWDSETWQELMVFREPGGTNTSLDWSPDSSRIVSGSRAKRVSVWDLESQTRIARLENVDDVVRNVDWSSDGKFVAANVAGKVVVWNSHDWTLQFQHSFWYDEDQEDDSLYALSFSLSSDRLFASGKSRQIHEIDFLQPNRKPKSIPARNEVFTLIDSESYRFIAAGLWRGGPRLWSSSTFEEIVTLEESKSIVRTVQTSTDGKLLLSASEEDQVISIWNLASVIGYEEVPFDKTPLAQHADANRILYVISEDDTFIRSTVDSDHLYQLDGKSTFATFGRNADQLVRATESAIEVWQLSNTKLIHKLELPDFPIWDLAISSDNRSLLVNSPRGDWTLYDLMTAEILAQNRSNSNDSPIYTFSPDGRSIVVFRYPRFTNQESRFEIRSTQDGRVLQTVVNLNWADSIASNHDFTKLFFAQDSGIAVYDIVNETIDTTHFRRRQGILRITISPDDQAIAVWVKGEGIFLWDARSGQELFPILLTSEIIDQLEFRSNSILQCRLQNEQSCRMAIFRVDANDTQ